MRLKEKLHDRPADIATKTGETRQLASESEETAGADVRFSPGGTTRPTDSTRVRLGRRTCHQRLSSSRGALLHVRMSPSVARAGGFSEEPEEPCVLPRNATLCSGIQTEKVVRDGIQPRDCVL